MVRMGRWNGVLAAALVLVLIGWPAALSAQDDPAKAQLQNFFERLAVLSLNQRATQFYQQGEYKKATELLEQVVKLAIKKFGPDHPDVATSLNNLAQLYRLQGRYAEAEPLCKRGLKIYEARFGPDHPNVATSLNGLAVLYQAQGRYAEAEPLYQRGLEIREAKLGPDHPNVATSLNGLAELYRSQGRYAEAEPLIKRSLKIREAKLGPDHPDVAQSLYNLAILYQSQGRYAEAEPLYQRSLKIYEAKLGPDHPNVATSLNDLAVLYVSQGRYAAVVELLLKRSLKIMEAKLGPDHPAMATSLNSVAELYRLQGRYADAELLFKRSLVIREAKLGPDHPAVATSLNNLALLHAAPGQWLDAVEAFDRARRTILRHIVRVLPALAEKEQLTFLKATDEGALHRALSLAVGRSNDHATAARSTGWVLNAKGLAQQALADRALLARDGEDPIAAKLVTQLRDVRNHLAALTLATPRSGQENDRKRELTRLDEQERELSKELGQVTGRTRREDPWVEPDAVCTALPADAVLVEIARFNVFDFQAKDRQKRWQPPHYAAWVIPTAGRGKVQVIDLGEAKPIEDAVAAARRALQPELELLRSRGEPDAEQQLQKPLQNLARLVLQPLLPHIGQAKRWLISPDAALSRPQQCCKTLPDP